jgi:hypothetical protein
VAAGATVEFDRFEGAEHFFVGCDDNEVRTIFERAMRFASTCVSTTNTR